jgi:hypothetical protein
MEHRDIVLDHRSFADHDGMGMIDHDAAADPGCGMDVRREDDRRPALQVIGEVAPPHVPQPMRHPIGLKCLISLEIEQRLYIAVARRITVIHGKDVDPGGLRDLGFGLERILEGLHDKLAADVGIAEPDCQALAQRPLEAVMVEHRPEHEASHARIIGDDRFRLLAYAMPDGVDGGDLRRSHRGGNSHEALLYAAKPDRNPPEKPVKCIKPATCGALP